MKKNEIKFRDAELNDAKFIWNIRNSKEVRAISLHQDYRPFSLFNKIYKDKLNKYKEYKIIIFKGKDIGYINKDNSDFISIALIREYRNKGIGKRALSKINGKAIILSNNTQSLKCFTKSNWNIKGFYLEK